VSDSEPGLSGSKGAGTNTTDEPPVVARPTRPSGKRARRGAVDADASGAVDLATGAKAEPTKNGSGTDTKKKTAKKGSDGPSRNPIAYVWNYLKQVVAELRKVIWPNRKQMVNYTAVVLVFLVFMVAMIGLVDLGLTKVVMLIFGDG